MLKKLLKLTVLILTTLSLVHYDNASCMEIEKHSDINHNDSAVDSIDSTELKITNRSLSEIFHEQIKESIKVEMKYFYKNTPSDSTGNCNNGMQCMVFTSYLSNHTSNPDIAELAYCSLNERYRKLYTQAYFRHIENQVNVESQKAEIMKNCCFSKDMPNDGTINCILAYKQMLTLHSDLRDYPWGWLLDDNLGNNNLKHKELNNNYAREFTTMVFSFTTWLSCTNDLFYYIEYFPAIVGEIFNVILYYTRIYQEFLNCPEYILSQSDINKNEIIARKFQHRFNVSHHNISKTDKLKIIEITKTEQKNLLSFTCDLINDIWSKFVVTNFNSQQLPVFEYGRYRECSNMLPTVKDKFKDQVDLIAYRFYTVCRKICNFIPYICNFGSETETRQNSYYRSLQNSYVAKKAIEVYDKQLKFIRKTIERTSKECHSLSNKKNKTNGQPLNQNISDSTVYPKIVKKQTPSINIEKDININTIMKQRANKDIIFKIEKKV